MNGDPCSFPRSSAPPSLPRSSRSAARQHTPTPSSIEQSPEFGSTLAAAPAKVRIWFTEALEQAFSTIAVTDPQGHVVADGKAKVDAANPMLLEVGLKPLAPGTYTVRWRVISVDTHPTEGDFTFTVKP